MAERPAPLGEEDGRVGPFPDDDVTDADPPSGDGVPAVPRGVEDGEGVRGGRVGGAAGAGQRRDFYRSAVSCGGGRGGVMMSVLHSIFSFFTFVFVKFGGSAENEFLPNVLFPSVPLFVLQIALVQRLLDAKERHRKRPKKVERRKDARLERHLQRRDRLRPPSEPDEAAAPPLEQLELQAAGVPPGEGEADVLEAVGPPLQLEQGGRAVPQREAVAFCNVPRLSHFFLIVA